MPPLVDSPGRGPVNSRLMSTKSRSGAGWRFLDMRISAGAAVLPLLAACASPAEHRLDADRVAGQIIADTQEEALGRTEPFTVEPPSETLRRRLLLDQGLPVTAPASLGSDRLEPVEHWPEGPERTGEPPDASPRGGTSPLGLGLVDALQVGARNSREYQSRKEEIFRTALDLDLEREAFRSTFTGLVEGIVGVDGASGETVTGTGLSGGGSIARRLESGAELTGRIAVDLVKLLTQDRSSSLGILADATVSIPLLRGAGRHIVTEPLQQAEREVVYAIWSFERFKREFAVEVAGSYLAVLQAGQEVKNAEENYRGLIVSTRSARRLAESGRLPGFQYDQALQNELRARNRWISARESHARRLDGLKLLLGLPVDARISLDEAELVRLADRAREKLGSSPEEGGGAEVPPADAPVILREPGGDEAGPLELSESIALPLALQRRLDLQVALGRVRDAQRKVVVAADALRGELTLLGSARAGERRTTATAGLEDASLDLSAGSFEALLNVDLPLERTAERNAFRESYINLERAVREVQALEDRVKLSVRDDLRTLRESREGMRIQSLAVAIAERRVKSTDLFLQAGRAEIRDVLESQEALINAQNALTAALVGYRLSELELQRDLGVLEVDGEGLWKEFDPLEVKDDRS